MTRPPMTAAGSTLGPALAAGLALGLAACGQPQSKATGTPDAAASSSPAAPATAMDAMPMAPTSEETGARTGSGTGVITAIDAAAGKITIEHGPIPDVAWPAMTMGFSAAPALVEQATVGDRIAFDLTVRGNVAEVTAIRPG